jgi:hypothetical protein
MSTQGDAVKKYRVSYTLRKGGTVSTATVDVNAESDRTAIKLAEGVVRQRQPQKADYTFTATAVRVM